MKEKSKKNIAENRNENIKVFGLVIAILIVILVVSLILKFVENNSKNDILKSKESKIVYIENSDEKKCKKCSEVKKYLDDQKIDYVLYDSKKYSEDDYNKLLQTLSINASDFNYPAVIYIRDGIMFSNIINIDQTKVVEQFLKDYDLKK